MNKHKISVLIIFLLFIFIYHSNVLGEGYWLSTINNVHQDCYNLCWAACMEAINTPLGNDGTSQCELIQKSANLGELDMLSAVLIGLPAKNLLVVM